MQTDESELNDIQIYDSYWNIACLLQPGNNGILELKKQSLFPLFQHCIIPLEYASKVSTQ